MESFIPTQSLQKIFTPIISQITELVIVTSDKYQTEDKSKTTNVLLPLVPKSENIVNSLKDLTTVCKQTIELEYSSDEIAKKEVDCASQNLLVSGESLVLCCHILCSSATPNFQLKTPVPHQTDVSTCLSDLNQHLLLLLLAVDDAEIRKIANFGHATTEALALLTTAEKIQVLTDYFRTFAVPAANLHISASARCQDLVDSKAQYSLKCSLTTLRQSLPMLTAALQMAIKYSDNNEVLKGRDFCVEQVRKAIADIIRIVTAKQARAHFLPDTGIGLFVKKISLITEMLSNEKRKKVNFPELSAHAETFIHHSMEMALALLKSGPSLELKSNSVVSSCRRLMRALRDFEKVHQEMSSCSSPDRALQDKYDEKCTQLRAIASGAKATVLHAVTVLVTHTFRFTDEPLNVLVDACVPLTIIAEDSKEEMEKQREDEIQKQELLSKAFLKHVESLFSAAKFSASCCSHDATYEKYGKVLMSLDQTSKAIPAAAKEHCPGKQKDEGDLMQYDKLLDLQEKWSEILGDLIQLIIASLDLKGLLEILVEEIFCSLEKCNEGIVNLDESLIATHLQVVTGKSRFLVRVSNAVASCSTDPVYRNGVLVHVKELKQNIANNIARGNQIIEDVARLNEQEMFLKSAAALKESVTSLVKAVLSDGNHPDLTSLDRFEVRQDDPAHTHAMLKEMHSLNEKLAALGFEPITEEEVNITLPEPSDLETKCPRYQYESEGRGETDDQNISQKIQIPDRYVESLPDLESLPGKIHPIVENLMQCLKKSRERMTTRARSLDNAKELIQRASELCMDIAKDTLSEDQEETDDKQAIQKASGRIGNLCELILKEVDELASNTEELELESLCMLGLQWSKALYVITVGCVRVQPLYVVPVRRYLALSLDTDVEDVHSLARHIVSYPGSSTQFLSKLAAFRQDSYKYEDDQSGIGDFSVHEQNVSELIQLINGISHAVTIGQEDERVAELAKEREISGLFEIINFDWSSACKLKEELLQVVKEMTSREETPVDKAFLQLLCLTWAYKVRTLHCSIMKTSRIITENFGHELDEIPIFKMVAKPEDMASEIKSYRQQIFDLISKQFEATSSTDLESNMLISTWNENLKVTGDVIDDILHFLCSVRTSTPLVFHHGHSMFHLVYLHHLFFLELSFLEISMTQPMESRPSTHRSAETEDTPKDKKSTLSARLRALKEERERRDESLNDILSRITH